MFTQNAVPNPPLRKSMLKNAIAAASAFVIGQGRYGLSVYQNCSKLSIDLSLKKSSALYKKLTAEMQSVRYAFRSVASTLVVALFNIQAPMEQSTQSQIQTRADLVKNLLDQQNYNFLHQVEMVYLI